VVFDGPRADEQSRADLGVGQGFAGQFGDLGLLRGEAAGGLDGAFAGGLAGGSQFASGALGDINRGSGWERNRSWIFTALFS
jgi:hypothetical protein